MRISDWSLDVCSSDLRPGRGSGEHILQNLGFLFMRDRFKLHMGQHVRQPFPVIAMAEVGDLDVLKVLDLIATQANLTGIHQRSEERRVGKECVSTCRSRRSPDN